MAMARWIFPFNLYALDWQTGQRRRLTTTNEQDGETHQSTPAGDGKHIAFSIRPAGNGKYTGKTGLFLGRFTAAEELRRQGASDHLVRGSMRAGQRVNGRASSRARSSRDRKPLQLPLRVPTGLGIRTRHVAATKTRQAFRNPTRAIR